MSGNVLTLFFAGDSSVELLETLFSNAQERVSMRCVRGRTPGVMRGAGTFQWSTAVRALSILCVKTALSYREGASDPHVTIRGGVSTWAASLDYALAKQPRWIQEMFGVDIRGTAFARRLLVRNNPERKRPGPVVLGLNPLILPAANIRIRLNGGAVDSVEGLSLLLANLREKEDLALARALERQVA